VAFSSSSADAATGASAIVALPVANNRASFSGARLAADTSKAQKAGSTTAIANVLTDFGRQMHTEQHSQKA
jgi:hypothetical protein